jgi:DNA-binding PadR family transcriptional regulator
MSPVAKKKKHELTDRQLVCLKILKRAPKTTTQAFGQVIKKNGKATKGAVHGCMRGLENKGLVRARSKWDRTLKRDLIVWELTAQGRKALA